MNFTCAHIAKRIYILAPSVRKIRVTICFICARCTHIYIYVDAYHKYNTITEKYTESRVFDKIYVI